jgi:hypothetical protein
MTLVWVFDRYSMVPVVVSVLGCSVVSDNSGVESLPFGAEVSSRLFADRSTAVSWTPLVDESFDVLEVYDVSVCDV